MEPKKEQPPWVMSGPGVVAMKEVHHVLKFSKTRTLPSNAVSHIQDPFFEESNPSAKVYS